MTTLTPEAIQFILDNQHADTNKLLLSASKYPELDIPFLVNQILARRQIREKLPEWYRQEALILPSRIAAEQCSSEQTAQYKQRLVKGSVLCDLTGGLGVDSYYLAARTEKSIYIERFAEYCEAARNNFRLLGRTHIEVRHGDSRDILPELGQIDCFYIDPARRSDVNKRLFALEDCEPNIIEMRKDLLARAQRLIIKISPMADLRLTLQLLPETTEVHILSVKNECKELLFVLDAQPTGHPVSIYCINYTTTGEMEEFIFTLEEEDRVLPAFANTVEKYLYEPNASVLKGGAFKSIATQLNLQKLQTNSHLYTSDTLCPNFPGRVFTVDEVIDFASRVVKKINSQIPKANITVRNFPLTVDQLRKKTGIREGGELYIFATTIGKDQKILIRCSKC